jgi:hypothetical protein
MWLSNTGLPQYFVLDLSEMYERPEEISCFGFDCWHDYPSNPGISVLKLSCHRDTGILR